MKIITFASYYFPESVASPYLGEQLREAIAAADMKLDLFVPIPTRGITEEQRIEYSRRRVDRKYNDKITIHRIPLLKEHKNPLQRAFRYFIQCVKYYFIGSFSKVGREADLLLVSSTPPILGATTALIKKHRDIPFVYDLQDIFPDSLVGTGLAKKGGLLWKIGRVIENFTYKHADKIIVISEDFKKNIMAKGVPEDKIVVIYNWVDQNKVVDVPREENKLFDAYGLDRSKFYITYNGNIGLTQNMDMLLDVAKELQEEYEDIHFVLVGNGAYLDEVKRKVADQQLENVHLLPFQPYEDISHVFSLGDASLVISKPGVGANSVPSKTWSIMSASRPVLANFDENELKTIIENNHCGIFTKAGDKDAFKESILTLYNHRELCQEYGRNGRKFVLDNLTREVGTQKYVDVIKEVCGKKAK
jgi:glycosyltransferase involved in cell wall biosynthesis